MSKEYKTYNTPNGNKYIQTQTVKRKLYESGGDSDYSAYACGCRNGCGVILCGRGYRKRDIRGDVGRRNGWNISWYYPFARHLLKACYNAAYVFRQSRNSFYNLCYNGKSFEKEYVGYNLPRC